MEAGSFIGILSGLALLGVISFPLFGRTEPRHQLRPQEHAKRAVAGGDDQVC
ncbi:hypothetical protein CLV77_0157 [Brevirhabdus pacifica]|nr:hypothetical protein CLV77_0157 [Brevirhabdus pacifica]